MECIKCSNQNIKNYNIKYDNYYIYIYLICDVCNSTTEYALKIKSHRKKEYHLPGYNNCGPGTDIIYNLKNNIKPINKTDLYCLLHDISYYMYKDKESRKKADKFLFNSISNQDKPYSISIPIIKAIIGFKIKADMY